MYAANVSCIGRSQSVKSLTRISMALIAIGLSLTLWSALYVIPFVQPERAQIAAGELHYMFSYENWVHEAGFGRFAISVVALLILFIPFRRGERWAFVALVFVAVAYYLPVFLFGGVPNLGTWPALRNWQLPQFKVQSLTWVFWSSFILYASLFLGLAMSAPIFFRRKGT
jgi:hypothetical protein